MQSPTKNYSKKARKPTWPTNAFSQPAVQTDVGEFKGGYFVMPDPVAAKENDRSRSNSHKQERSPGRRKQQANESNATTSPNKERSNSKTFEYDYPKKPYQSTTVDAKDFKKEPLSPSKMYNYDQSLTKNTSSSKDVLSTSPPTKSERWAGPAFGNAPPPSSLPLPEFPPMTAPLPISSHQPVFSPSTNGSYPQVPQGVTFQALSASPPHYLSTSPPHYLPSPHQSPYSSIPAVPFPYVSSAPPSPLPMQSLTQLSTDLRRLLNINVALVDPISVSNSS